MKLIGFEDVKFILYDNVSGWLIGDVKTFYLNGKQYLNLYDNLNNIKEIDHINNPLLHALFLTLKFEIPSNVRTEIRILGHLILQLLKDDFYKYVFNFQQRVGNFRIDLVINYDNYKFAFVLII